MKNILSVWSTEGAPLISRYHRYHNGFSLHPFILKRSNQYQSKTWMQGVQLVGEFTTIYEIQGSISSSAEENQTTITPQMLQMEDTPWL